MMRWAAACRAGVLGFADEVWWSRLAQPSMHSWCEQTPLHLNQKQLAKDDKTPKAVACYGLYLPETNQMRLRFVDNRPISAVTCLFLHWLLDGFSADGKRALFLIWDNASWHISKEVISWIKAYNRNAKRQGRCRLIVCRLPVKSPWLNPIEPKWLHGKRAIVEPDRVLSADELKQRICDYYGCSLLDSIAHLPC
jgi:hypothetical protein